MKKRIFPIIAAAMVIVSAFTACSSSKNDVNSKLPSAAPTPAPHSSASPTPAPATPKPSAAPDESSSLSKAEKDIELKSFREALMDEYGDDYVPDTVLTDDEIMEKTGLTEDMFTEIYGEVSSNEENPDIFLAVRAKDGREDEVKQAFEKYKNSLLEDQRYEAYSDRIKSAEIYSHDDYVFMILLGTDDFGEDVENIGERFMDEIRRGVDAIKDVFVR